MCINHGDCATCFNTVAITKYSCGGDDTKCDYRCEACKDHIEIILQYICKDNLRGKGGKKHDMR